MSRVGVAGLGAMGSRVARRLLDAGHVVVVWNRTAGRAAELIALGATAAGTPAELARGAEVVITMLADPAALAAVVAQLGEGLDAGATVIDMSTVGPAAVHELAGALPTGVGLLDAPVLGSIAEAEAGSLKIFVGGDAELVARWTPLLAALGTPVPVGASGTGAAAKLVANSTLFAVLGALGEALALAEGLGLDRATAFDVLATTPLAAQSERRRAAIESGDFPPRFTLTLARKDADLVVDAAQRAGVDVRLARAACLWLADAERAGSGQYDYSALLAHILGS